jgi:formylmethanofuran--tetrahydromethanopterin N-formyltransferase
MTQMDPKAVIEDTFAEAFPLTVARVIVTADHGRLVHSAAMAATGFASSIIGCDVEAGIDCELSAETTPDGRPGASLLFFSFSRPLLEKSLVNRIGQAILTCPTTACYNGLPVDPEKSLKIGSQLRFFGDGWQGSKKLGDRRFWRIPVMDGEFLVEEKFGTVKGVGGGNLILLCRDAAGGLEAAEACAAAMRGVPGVILPFPHGIVRAGSKVGSRYKALKASTNEAYCPTLRALVPSQMPVDSVVAYEIVADGIDLISIEEATRRGITAISGHPSVIRITAGNYGGKLGPFHLYLRTIAGLSRD